MMIKQIMFDFLCFLENMSSYVGFANLPNQVHRKTVKRGFEFTLMVVGKNFSIMQL